MARSECGRRLDLRWSVVCRSGREAGDGRASGTVSRSAGDAAVAPGFSSRQCLGRPRSSEPLEAAERLPRYTHIMAREGTQALEKVPDPTPSVTGPRRGRCAPPSPVPSVCSHTPQCCSHQLCQQYAHDTFVTLRFCAARRHGPHFSIAVHSAGRRVSGPDRSLPTATGVLSSLPSLVKGKAGISGFPAPGWRGSRAGPPHRTRRAGFTKQPACPVASPLPPAGGQVQSPGHAGAHATTWRRPTC